MNADVGLDRQRRLPLGAMRKSTPTTFDGTRLRERRTKAGVSIDDLACQAGRHFRSVDIECYESGDRQPSFDRIQQLAEALDIDLVDLLDRNAATSAHHWYREAAGMSHVDVAEKLEVHRTTVARWDVTGDVPDEHLEACAALYATTPAELSTSGERISVNLSPTIAQEVDRRRGKQPRERYLSDLVTSLHQRPV